MADTEATTKRKSVAFSDDTKIVDEDGRVTEATTNGTSDQQSAESHSAGGDPAVDEVTEALAAMGKKKKKPKKPKDQDEAEAPAADGEFDPSAMIAKKKKKKKAPAADADDFEAKLAKAGAGEKDEDKDGEADHAEQEGDMEAGTGIWAHNCEAPISYEKLLDRFFTLLEHARGGSLEGPKSHRIPPPQCLREGNKKTIFANIADIAKRIKRSDEHVTQFLFAELGTSGSVDGSRRLVIKGRFQQKQIENVLRRYIVEYVTCKTCKSPDTTLSKAENRLTFLTCNSCGSRRSVTAIKTGFTAQIGKRKRQQG